jgi:hypothetical protein
MTSPPCLDIRRHSIDWRLTRCEEQPSSGDLPSPALQSMGDGASSNATKPGESGIGCLCTPVPQLGPPAWTALQARAAGSGQSPTFSANCGHPMGGPELALFGPGQNSRDAACKWRASPGTPSLGGGPATIRLRVLCVSRPRLGSTEDTCARTGEPAGGRAASSASNCSARPSSTAASSA